MGTAMSIARQSRPWLLMAILGLVCGCGGPVGPPREAVSGKVTVDGRPLERGDIQFLPTKGSQSGAGWGSIVDGAYEISGSDGPVAGDYSVSITSSVKPATSSTSADELPGEPIDESPAGAISETYNLRTVLKATIVSDKPNRFDFNVTSAKTPSRSRRR
jgi:hypothetical protein